MTVYRAKNTPMKLNRTSLMAKRLVFEVYRAISGAQPYAVFESVIEEELQK